MTAPRTQKPQPKPQPQTIARAARAAGVNVETIRYYERIGLIERPRAVGTAVRIYPDDTVRRIRFIKRAQKLGFTLKEIRELLGLRVAPGGASTAVRRRVEGKLADIDRKLRALRAMRRTLTDLLEACRCSRGGADCPILASLDEEAPAGLRATKNKET